MMVDGWCRNHITIEHVQVVVCAFSFLLQCLFVCVLGSLFHSFAVCKRYSNNSYVRVSLSFLPASHISQCLCASHTEL